MKNIIAEFDPSHGIITSTLLICLMVLVAAVAFAYFNQNRKVEYKDRNMKNLFTLLAMFVAVFALGFGGFEFFLNKDVSKVTLYENGLHLPKGEVNFSKVRNIYIYNANQSAVSAGQKGGKGDKVLIVEQYNGKNHYLYEKDYDIQNIIKPIREQFDKTRSNEQ